ncbi:winged helix DNA-binding domain-containing protein [Sistotremastrum suecicum HHB10207 ss-3]|uniref:Winged helix DNA-binding domain-containing protein n=1 Tax=Sistotremastrum suecicum HHB10207 ss-3 TaxID=1314776 RepID=A0A166I2G5_9AGAM|nr:winged helix DNA-binding domain-containing protein [Sistotremastrum suecicum HHB10207 ss-3]
MSRSCKYSSSACKDRSPTKTPELIIIKESFIRGRPAAESDTDDYPVAETYALGQTPTCTSGPTLPLPSLPPPPPSRKRKRAPPVIAKPIVFAKPKKSPLGKPNVPYAALAGEAILASPDHRCTLNEIYDYVAVKYPYFEKGKTPYTPWQNCIRQALSLNKCFSKLDTKGRPLKRAVKGSLWAVFPEYEHCFVDGGFSPPLVSRRETPVKTKLGSQEASGRDSTSAASEAMFTPRAGTPASSLSDLTPIPSPTFAGQSIPLPVTIEDLQLPGCKIETEEISINTSMEPTGVPDARQIAVQ